MSLVVGDNIVNGKLVIVQITDDFITSVTFPSLKNTVGDPYSVSYNPGITQQMAQEAIEFLIQLFGG